MLFRVAAGPRIGFGHLMRARTLAAATGLPFALSLRGGPAARRTAHRLGMEPRHSGARQALVDLSPSVLVVDDPNARESRVWRVAARRLGVPILSIHDLGIGAGDADIVVDGSVVPGPIHASTEALTGPRFAIIRAPIRRTAGLVVGAAPRVVISLGGGPRTRLAHRLGLAIISHHPTAVVQIASGLVPRLPGSRREGRVETLADHMALRSALAGAQVAVVSGGVTMYEACAGAVPCVAVAVVQGQRPAIRGLARRGAVIDGGGGPPDWWTTARVERAAEAVAALCDDREQAATLSRQAARLVDGRGASRVAVRLRQLAREGVGRSRRRRGRW